MDLLGYIPGDDEHPTVVTGGVEFTVEKVEDRRILRVRAHKLPVENKKDDGKDKDKE